MLSVSYAYIPCQNPTISMPFLWVSKLRHKAMTAQLARAGASMKTQASYPSPPLHTLVSKLCAAVATVLPLSRAREVTQGSQGIFTLGQKR